MDIRAFWEALSIGKVSLLIHDDELIVVTFFWVCISLFHLIVGLTNNYLVDDKYDYGRNTREPKKIWSSMYCIFYIPILVFFSSLEFIVLIQCSFMVNFFWGGVFVLGLYELVKAVISAANEEIVCPLGLMGLAQAIGVEITAKKKLFFEDSILAFKASYDIKRKQKRALK
jgi:hypothetical protein